MELLLGKQNLDLQTAPADTMPGMDRGDITVDNTRLIGMFMQDFRNDISNKESMGWVADREYDLKAYYQQKEEAWKWTPWKGASAYRSPLTATLVDTALSAFLESIFGNSGSPVGVKGTGVEDIRTAKILELYLNNLIDTESNLSIATDMNVFRMLLSGTGIIKVKRTLGDTGVECVSLDTENIYVPLGAKGFKKDQTDHVIQIIPLTGSELNYRRLMGVYGDIRIQSGLGLGNTANENKMQTIDKNAGTSMSEYTANSIYYIAEYYKTYWDKESQRPKEITAWITPNGGQVLRVKENKEKIRPFSRHVIYEHEDQRFFGISMPKKIKEIQEKLDYSDKQLTDAMDKSNMPAMFIDNTGDFDPSFSQRRPGGVYQVGVGRKIDYEPIPHVERGFDKERFDLWAQAEKLTGLIDVIQGASTKSGRTLGETEIRTQSATTRFKTLLKRYEVGGFNDTISIMYQYQNLYVPRDKKVKLIGYADYTTLDELFPVGEQKFYGLGIEGNYNFVFSNKSLSERNEDMVNYDKFYEKAMLNPATAMNPANFWNLLNEWSQKYGIRNLETVIFKPKEAYLITAPEFIQRVMAGQYNTQLRPGIDYENYQFEIQLFMRSEQFKYASDECKQALIQAMTQVNAMLEADRKAKMDMMMAQDYIQKRNNMELGIGQPSQGQPEPTGQTNGQPLQ